MKFPPPYQLGNFDPRKLFDCHPNGPACVAECRDQATAKDILQACNEHADLVALRDAVGDFLRAEAHDTKSYTEIIEPLIAAYQKTKEPK